MAAKTCAGDPVFGLTIQRRVGTSNQDSIIRLAKIGNNYGIRLLLNKREAFPDDADIFDGQTALHVGDCNNNEVALTGGTN